MKSSPLSKLTFAFCWFTAASFTYAQSAQIIRFDGGGNGEGDHANTITVDNSGAIIVGGMIPQSTSDSAAFAVVKHNAQGTLQWFANYRGAPGEISGGVSSVVTDAAGNSYAGGTIARRVSSLQLTHDWLVVSFDPHGVQRWAHVFNNPDNGLDQAVRLVIDPAGSLYATGVTGSGNDLNWLTMKYSLNGALQWQRIKSGAANADDRPVTARLAPDGGLVVLGYTSNIGVGLAKDCSVVKYDAQGNLLWSQTFTDTASSEEFPGDLAVDSAGNSYITGITLPAPSPELPNVPFTLSYDVNGSLRFIAKNDTAGGASIALTSDGNLIVAGTAVGDAGSSVRSSVSKLTSDGVQLWTTPLDTAGEVAIDTDGTIYVGGTRFTSMGYKFFATKLTSGGQKLWDQSLEEGGIAPDAHLDAAGNFFVTGDTRALPTDILTIRYPRNFVPSPTPAGPTAPSGLTLAAAKQKLTLRWNDNSTNETGFRIERSINGGSFLEIAVTGVNARNFTDTGLNKRNSYSYRVRATNSSGNSAYSNTATGSPN
jgi:hypothetical protein